jgi:hypothetical protein
MKHQIKNIPLQFHEFFMYHKTQILRAQIVAVQILRETATLQFGENQSVNQLRKVQ